MEFQRSPPWGGGEGGRKPSNFLNSENNRLPQKLKRIQHEVRESRGGRITIEQNLLMTLFLTFDSNNRVVPFNICTKLLTNLKSLENVGTLLLGAERLRGSSQHTIFIRVA